MAKKRQDHNSNYKRYLLIGVLTIAFVLVVLSLLSKQESQQYSGTLTKKISPAPNVKTYHSDFLKTNITIPEDFTVKEEFGQVTLERDNKNIMFHRIGTNKKYGNIVEFLEDDFNSDNIPKNVKKSNLVIDGQKAMEVITEYPTSPQFSNKAYYIHIDDGFHHLYTTSPELYQDLDQIARSFRYKE